MTTLREARDKGRLDQFIKEQEADGKVKGDRRAFDKTVSAMAGKSKPIPETSKKDERGD